MIPKTLLPSLAVLALGAVQAAAGGAVERALEAELARARELKAEGYPTPYYASLTATEVDSWQQRCGMGSPSLLVRFRQALVTPDVRVGGHALDNHPVSFPSGFVGSAASLEEDEFSLRHVLWRILDGAYKSAAAEFLRKQALRVSRGKTEYDTDDLSREAPRLMPASRPEALREPEALARLCLKASSAFRQAPWLLQGEAEIRSRREWSRLRDSDGSRVDFGREWAEIELEAVALSSDGIRLAAARRFVATAFSSLPSPERVRESAREMTKDLMALRLAQTTSPFSAPALLDPSVAAAVVLALGSSLSGEQLRNPAGAQIFRDKIGRMILPGDFDLVDDPTLKDFGGLPLAGHYDFDDQGVGAQRIVLVSQGVLKGFLLSRYPVIGFARSNGHGRALPGYWPVGSPGNLILSSGRRLSEKALWAELREECRRRGKPYGLWVRRLRSHSFYQGTGGQGSIRLMPGLLYLVEAETGRLTLVRELDLVGTPLVLISNILRAGDDAQAHSFASPLPVSVVAPSLLLADAELQRAEARPEKPPILAPPRPGPE